MKKISIPALLCIVTLVSFGNKSLPTAESSVSHPQTNPVTQTSWMGFKRTDIQVAGRSCIIIEPNKAIAGKPWIWRTEFFGHEPQGDSSLAAKGFHVVYMDVQNMYGAPVAMALMDSFYTFLTTNWALDRKTVWKDSAAEDYTHSIGHPCIQTK